MIALVKVLFLQQLKNAKLNKQFKKFLEVFKQLHINILFVDVIEQISSYPKLLNDILMHKRKIEDCSTIFLSKECSVIIHQKAPI